MNKSLIILLLLFLFCSAVYSQSNTIKVDAPVGLMLEKDLPASDYKTGDTILVFTVTDDLKVNTPTGQSILAVKKGAYAKAVVSVCVMPYKQKTKDGDSKKVYDGQGYYDREVRRMLRSGGEIVVTIVAVQSVNGSYMPLSDCPIAKIGGIDGGYKNDKTMATIPAGTRKVCNTRYPYAILTY